MAGQVVGQAGGQVRAWRKLRRVQALCASKLLRRGYRDCMRRTVLVEATHPAPLSLLVPVPSAPAPVAPPAAKRGKRKGPKSVRVDMEDELMEDGTPTPMNAGNRAHPAYAGSRDKRKRKVGHSSNSSSRWWARLQGASRFVVFLCITATPWLPAIVHGSQFTTGCPHHCWASSAGCLSAQHGAPCCKLLAPHNRQQLLAAPVTTLVFLLSCFLLPSHPAALTGA